MFLNVQMNSFLPNEPTGRLSARYVFTRNRLPAKFLAIDAHPPASLSKSKQT